MSVQINNYIMFGIVLDYEAIADHEALEPLEDNAFEAPRPFSEVTCVADGMNGQYVALGFVFNRTKDGDHFNGIIELPAIDHDHLALMERELARVVPPETKYQKYRWLVIGHYR